MYCISVLLIALLGSSVAVAQHHHDHGDMSSGGMADPRKHEFADPKLGRDGYELASEEVNQFRVYDFYKREADYFMQQEPKKFLPAYPGLDAGLHGHWGKHNQNNHSDDRWNEQDSGTLMGAQLHVGKIQVHKGINVLLGDDGELAACFDPWSMTYRYVWSGGFVKYNGYRWGTSRGVTMDGKQLLHHSGVWKGNNTEERIKDAKFHGVYRHGRHAAFSYSIGGLEVMDSPWASSINGVPVMIRSLQLNAKDGKHELPLFEIPKEATPTMGFSPVGSTIVLNGYTLDKEFWFVGVEPSGNMSRPQVVKTDDGLRLKIRGPVDGTCTVSAWHWREGDANFARPPLVKLPTVTPAMDFVAGGPAQWTHTVTLEGEIAAATDAYVIDKLPVPFDNPYNSVMMFSGIDFLPNGDALVATLSGDVWKVSGIDDELRAVTWKRFAAGLHQPFGIKIQGDDIFVLCKDRMQILRDLNNDGEADFYENYDNSWAETHGHTHVFGADRDREGNFYFPAYDKFYKLPPDGGGVKLFAKGFRNCMGVAVNDDGLVLAAPQEGTWTPASMIIEVREGEHYGFQRNDEKISSPMCFIPRGVDNSTGGMVFVDSDRWGPLGKSLLGLSYGSGSHYLILRDESVPRAQGATVPLKGEFKSGIVRGRISPKDGQLYVVGTDGWGNYAITDGSLDRVRYTGKPVHKPIGFQGHSNGIRIDFTEPVDADVAGDPRNYFVQQWNYEHSKGYGSVEFSVFRPHMIGHDRVDVTSVQVLNDGRSVFLEIPRIVPCYQMHVRMHLAAADGTAFKTDLFPTILSLGKRFDFDGARADVPNRAAELQLRVKEPGAVVLKGHNEKLKTTRTITLNAVSGIRYDRTTLVAHAGEAIELKLKNNDGMPHNLVLVQPGAYEKVGQTAFKMLNDPTAFDRQYVPDLPEVITHTAVVFPNRSSSTKFRVPEEAGAYPFLCTFPGHWQAMRGQLIVVPLDQPLPDPTEYESATLASQLAQEDPAALVSEARQIGNSKAGKKLFHDKKISCATCHAPPTGPHLGPKLNERHDKTNDLYLLDSILNPSKEIRKGYEPVIVMTFDGKMRSGVRVSEDEETISLRDITNGGQLLKYRKEDLDDVVDSKVSMMPAGLVNNLQSKRQFLDLLSYVFTISEGRTVD